MRIKAGNLMRTASWWKVPGEKGLQKKREKIRELAYQAAFTSLSNPTRKGKEDRNIWTTGHGRQTSILRREKGVSNEKKLRKKPNPALF